MDQMELDAAAREARNDRVERCAWCRQDRVVDVDFELPDSAGGKFNCSLLGGAACACCRYCRKQLGEATVGKRVTGMKCFDGVQLEKYEIELGLFKEDFDKGSLSCCTTCNTAASKRHKRVTEAAKAAVSVSLTGVEMTPLPDGRARPRCKQEASPSRRQ